MSRRMNALRMSLASVLLAGLLSALAGCGRDSEAASGREVRIGYFANLTHAQAVLGVASGEFASAVAPARLTPKVFNAGPGLIEALFAGEIDIGYVGPGPVLSANERTRGLGVRVVGGAAANGVLIVARKDSGVRNISDLAGRRVATPQHGNTQDIAARYFLQTELKQADLKNVTPIGNAEQSAMMERGHIDVAWAPEPWGTRMIVENGAKLVAEEKDLWPEKRFALTVVVTTPEFLAAHPEVVGQVLRVNHTWTRRLQAEPERYAGQLGDALLALTGKRLPAGVSEQALRRVAFTDEPMPETFERMGRWSYELGFLRRVPRLDRLFDRTVLDRVRQGDGTAVIAGGVGTNG